MLGNGGFFRKMLISSVHFPRFSHMANVNFAREGACFEISSGIFEVFEDIKCCVMFGKLCCV